MARKLLVHLHVATVLAATGQRKGAGGCRDCAHCFEIWQHLGAVAGITNGIVTLTAVVVISMLSVVVNICLGLPCLEPLWGLPMGLPFQFWFSAQRQCGREVKPEHSNSAEMDYGCAPPSTALQLSASSETALPAPVISRDSALHLHRMDMERANRSTEDPEWFEDERWDQDLAEYFQLRGITRRTKPVVETAPEMLLMLPGLEGSGVAASSARYAITADFLARTLGDGATFFELAGTSIVHNTSTTRTWIALAFTNVLVLADTGVPKHHITCIDGHITLMYAPVQPEQVIQSSAASCQRRLESSASKTSVRHLHGQGLFNGMSGENYAWLDVLVSSRLHATCFRLVNELSAHLMAPQRGRPNFHMSFRSRHGTTWSSGV